MILFSAIYSWADHGAVFVATEVIAQIVRNKQQYIGSCDGKTHVMCLPEDNAVDYC